MDWQLLVAWPLPSRSLLVLLPALALAFAPSEVPEERLPLDLLARAEAEGTVRVIVELRVGSEGIRAAQDALLLSLDGTQHRVTRRLTAIPFLALEVSAQALRLLAASPAVVRIEEDRLHAPQDRGSP